MIIRQIGSHFSPQFKQLEYFSDHHILEADILIIDISSIAFEIKRFLSDSYTRGKVLKEEDYTFIQEKIADRNEDLDKYFENGGTLFVFFPPIFFFECKLLRGSEHTGGILEKITIDLLSTVGLDSKDFEIKSQVGDVIIFEEPYKSFFAVFPCSYDFIFTRHIGLPIGKVVRSTQPVSLLIPIRKGNLMLLPEMKYVDNAFSAFSTIDKNLKFKIANQDTVQAPSWVEDITLGDEASEKAILSKLISNKREIELSIENQTLKVDYYKNLKRLLFSTGLDLEQIVEWVLGEIGYKIEPTEPGRDDLIISNKKDIIVAEIKGVKGSASEKNAAQLMKWVSGYHADNGFEPKGILIVNAFKDKPINQRTEQVFPNQMLPYCKRNKLGLITTTQLLELYIDFKASNISLDNIHQLLISTIGLFKYDNINKIKSIS